MDSFFGNIIHIIPTISAIVGTLAILIQHHIKDKKVKAYFALTGLLSWGFTIGYFVMNLATGGTFGTELNILGLCLLIIFVRGLTLTDIILIGATYAVMETAKKKKKK